MVNNISDPQAKEIATLFSHFDTDRDGYISPRSATKLCQVLGFHLEPSSLNSSSPLCLQDVMSWCDTFCGQCLRNDELRLAQKFSLLRGCDIFASGSRISRAALAKFLDEEGHVVRPEVLEVLMQEIGTEGQLSKADLALLVGERSTRGSSPQRRQLGLQRIGRPAA